MNIWRHNMQSGLYSYLESSSKHEEFYIFRTWVVIKSDDAHFFKKAQQFCKVMILFLSLSNDIWSTVTPGVHLVDLPNFQNGYAIKKGQELPYLQNTLQ